MRRHTPTAIEQGGFAAIVVLALVAAALTGCGIGPAGAREEISKTATTYLRALADGDTAKACAQLTRRARGGHCQAAIKAQLPRLEADALRNAADGSLDIHVDGKTATAALSQPHAARFVLTRAGDEWRIDSGYTVRAAQATAIPRTPVGTEIAWALAQLNGGAAKLTAAGVAAHFSPRFLAVVQPARAIVAMLGQTGDQRGPFTFTGFAYPPTSTQAIALIETNNGDRGSLRVRVGRGKPPRIIGFEVSEAPPALAPSGRHSGRFDIGGRKLFLHCIGTGSPTVVFQGGLTTDWVPVQNRVARFTRACSYDPANAPWGRSDPAPTPRTAKDIDADLHALLRRAQVPTPYVLVGHSDAGLFAQLYASEHPAEVKGLVLIDAVSRDYYARRIALLKKLLPPAATKAIIPRLRARPPALLDPEQHDMETSQAQLRAALATAPLHPMPLFVLTHGRVDDPSTDPRIAVADDRLWRSLQNELAALVPNSKHVVAKRSGHDIHHDEPGLVVSAIRDVVEAVRDPQTWRTP
jgi:pimeloyl-ACP methyl ester carboxylesterase